MNWYFKAFRQYADFNGRARRKEFWLFRLIEGIIFYLLCGIGAFLFYVSESILFFLLPAIYLLGALIPSVALTVRRLHDVGRSGLWFFFTLVPLVGGIWFFIMMCTEGDLFENKYGPSPKKPLSLQAVFDE